MQRCEDNVAARLNGNALQPLSDVFVTVTDDHTGLPAALYSDNGVTQVFQPLKTDDNGYYGFYAANGEYTLTFSGIRIATFTRKVVLNDFDDNPAVTKAELAAGSGSSLMTFMQAGTGAVPRPTESKLRELPAASDFGAVDDGLADDTAAEANAASIATSARNLLRSLWMYKFPKRGIKVWKRTFGIKDQAAVVSINGGDDTTEPVTQVLGFALDSDVSVYGDRDHVGLFVQNTALPPLVTTANTTFTATTVTSVDLASAIAAKSIKRGMFIDTIETPRKTGKVVSCSGNTVTVSAWFIVDGSRSQATPASGIGINVNPSTKVWAMNANVLLPANAQANSVVGFELGLVNDKSDGMGYLYDAVNLGSKKGGTAFQSRASFVEGFHAFNGTDYAFIAQTAAIINFYAQGGPTGFQSDTATGAAFIAKGAAKSLLVTDTSNNILSYIDGDGTHGRMKLKYATFANTSTIDAYSVVCSSVVVSSTSVINLPDPTGANANRVLYLKNPKGSTASALFAGLVEDASGSIGVAAGKCIQVISDGSKWIPIAQY